MEEEKFISFRVPIELAEQAKKRAKSQHRSLQGHMLHLIESDLAEHEKSAQKIPSKASNISPPVSAKITKGSESLGGGPSTRSTGRSRKTG